MLQLRAEHKTKGLREISEGVTTPWSFGQLIIFAEVECTLHQRQRVQYKIPGKTSEASVAIELDSSNFAIIFFLSSGRKRPVCPTLHVFM